MGNEIRIKVKKRKTYINLIGMLIFQIVLCIVVFMPSSELIGSPKGGRGYIIQQLFFTTTEGVYVFKLVMLYMLFLTLTFTFFFIKKLTSKKDVFVINSSGVTDHSNPISLGYIPWKDIESICFDNIYGQECIMIDLNNVEEYIGKSNFFKRIALRRMLRRRKHIVIIDLKFAGTNVTSMRFQIKEIIENSNVNSW